MRFKLRELTPRRVSDAALRRVFDLRHAAAWQVGRSGASTRSRLERYRAHHAERRCVIIGNGPSLTRMDLSPLRHEITFGMNRIYLLFEQLGFAPTYYTCVNELVLQQFRDDIAALPMPKFLNWNQRSLFPERDDLMFVRPKLAFKDTFKGDATKPICSGGTVTYVALQLAYFMGFREVILIGVDHRFTEPGTPNQTLVREATNDPNHFHPNYFPRGSRWQYPDLQRSEQAYTLARDAFSRVGGRVLDATLDGNCHVFEKVSYDQLFRRAATAERA